MKPRPDVTKYVMALPDHCLTCGRAMSQEKALLYRGSQPVQSPGASSRPRKEELLVFPVIDPSMVAWTSVCPVHVVSQ